MKRSTSLLALVVLVSCGPLTVPGRGGGGREPSRTYTKPPSREIRGELRRGDDICEFLCDKHRFTWAADGEVTLSLYTDWTDHLEDMQVFGPDGAELPRIGDGHGLSSTYDVHAGVAYEVRVEGPSRKFGDTYKLTLQPPPSSEQLAEERPIPPPPTPEEEEPDDTLDARIAALTDGWSAVGAAKRVDLEGKKRALTWKAKAGGCYAAYLVLEAGARVEHLSEPDLRMSVKDKYASHGTRGFFENDSRRLLSVGKEGDLCAETAGSVELALGEPGTGHVNVSLFERRTDPKLLRAQALDEARDDCTACMAQRVSCQQTGDTGDFRSCKAQFKDCTLGLRVQCKP